MVNNIVVNPTKLKTPLQTCQKPAQTCQKRRLTHSLKNFPMFKHRYKPQTFASSISHTTKTDKKSSSPSELPP